MIPTRHVRLALLTLGACTLSACGGLVGAFVPAQTVANPAQLDGATLRSDAPLRAQRVAGVLSFDTAQSVPSRSFDNLKMPENVPFGIRPHAVSLSATFTDLNLQGACAHPDHFELRLDRVVVAVSDDSGRAELSAEPGLSVTATRVSDGLTGARYQLADHAAQLSASGQTVDAALRILTGGGRNDALARAELSADADGLAGCSAEFTLGHTSVTLSQFH